MLLPHGRQHAWHIRVTMTLVHTVTNKTRQAVQSNTNQQEYTRSNKKQEKYQNNRSNTYLLSFTTVLLPTSNLLGFEQLPNSNRTVTEQ